MSPPADVSPVVEDAVAVTAGSPPPELRRWATLFGLTLLAWLPSVVWWAAFKPGIMTVDSLWIWSQAVNGPVVDWHSPVYTLGSWASYQLTGTPSVLILGQGLLLATGVVATGRALLALGARTWAVWTACTAVVLLPTYGVFSVHVWKDVAYTGAFFLLVACTVRLVAAADEHRLHWLYATYGSLLALVLLRQNAVLVALTMTVLLTIAFRRLWRQILLSTGALIAVLVVVKVALYPLLGVQVTPDYLSLSPLHHDIAAVVADDPSTLSSADRAWVEGIDTLDGWQQRYICYSVNPLLFSNPEAEQRFSEASEDRAEVVGVWVRAVLADPGTFLRHRLCVSSLAWRPDSPDGNLYTISTGIDPNGFGLATTPLSDRLHRTLLDVASWTDAPSRRSLLWRAPLWIYLAYVVVGVAAYRARRPRLLVVLAPLAAQQMSFLIANATQDARYLVPALFAALLLLPAATVGRAAADTAAEDDPLAATDAGGGLEPSLPGVAGPEPGSR